MAGKSGTILAAGSVVFDRLSLWCLGHCLYRPNAIQVIVSTTDFSIPCGRSNQSEIIEQCFAISESLTVWIWNRSRIFSRIDQYHGTNSCNLLTRIWLGKDSDGTGIQYVLFLRKGCPVGRVWHVGNVYASDISDYTSHRRHRRWFAVLGTNTSGPNRHPSLSTNHQIGFVDSWHHFDSTGAAFFVRNVKRLKCCRRLSDTD